jgi:hypothetical protein
MQAFTIDARFLFGAYLAELDTIVARADRQIAFCEAIIAQANRNVTRAYKMLDLEQRESVTRAMEAIGLVTRDVSASEPNIGFTGAYL